MKSATTSRIACVLLLAAMASAQTASPQKSSSPKSSKSTHAKSHRAKSHKTSSRKRGQQKIDSDRARKIQEALIREHYLNGKPSGTWDDATQNAMKHYQADNGWQNKTTPDARALIKLGLGPDHEHLLNPDSAMTTQPQAAQNVSESTPATSSHSDK